ncbi:cofactor-independent phosphoglycerate mutase [uncultured Muribaculum sp.]|uniref:cofactor-independent phosphoglycerate mutase n=2 Tax=uncultured Muribaculum sp. TaxID=1918613 RepID=UPI00272A266F|nr:cofactor-independent phosphoglycerate mutase [uncultured Muribaculum sp.]
MKYIVVLGDGMADEPIPELGGKTPLEAADTPVMDMLARKGCVGRLVTVPEGFHPGSEIANLSVLGYNVPEVFEGRGVLEAANMGVDIKPGDMAMRCNLICISDGRIKNHSGGHISTEEAHEIIATLQQELGDDTVHFYPGVSYRHLLILKGGDKRVSCTPPHDVPGTAFADVMVKADVPEAEATARKLNELIMRSQKILESHPVNLRRKAEGKDCANSIWPWSPGYRPSMRPMTEEFGIKSGVVISAVDLIFGIGVYAGLKPVYVEGATGLYDTNYEGKAQAAIDALRNGADFVFLHVEASDEAGHEGDYELKKRTIEYLDNRILRPLMDAVSEMDESVAVAVLPDHPTPCRLRTHTSAPVPFLIYRPGDTPDDVTVFSEESAADGGYGLLTGSQFIKSLIK